MATRLSNRRVPRGYVDLGMIKTPAIHLDLRLRAHRLGLVLPYPCTRQQARKLINEALDALRAADRG